MRIWSKLQKQIYLIIDDKLNLQIHCSKYRMNSQCGSTDLPRYWITLNKDIIFDYPKNAISKENYPYITEISDISNIFRKYLDTPKEHVLTKKFTDDEYGITDLLRSADRRIGVEKLEQYLQNNTVKNIDICKKIIKSRISK